MRLVIQKTLLRRILQWAQRAAFACAALLLGFCGFALVDAWMFQRRENADLDRQLRERGQVSANAGPLARRLVSFPSPKYAPPSATAAPPSPKAAPAAAVESLAVDVLIGRLEIPRLRMSTVVVEGLSRKTLRRAVGHIPGTALPGQPGNVGLAGHRDSFFRPLKDLKIKDKIQLSTLEGDFKYEVESIAIVEPNDVAVLAASDRNVLTLVTCYPFSYVGAAPKRLIARARQVWPQTGPPWNVE